MPTERREHIPKYSGAKHLLSVKCERWFCKAVMHSVTSTAPSCLKYIVTLLATHVTYWNCESAICTSTAKQFCFAIVGGGVNFDISNKCLWCLNLLHCYNCFDWQCGFIVIPLLIVFAGCLNYKTTLLLSFYLFIPIWFWR